MSSPRTKCLSLVPLLACECAAPVLIDHTQDDSVREIEGRLPERLANQLRKVLRMQM